MMVYLSPSLTGSVYHVHPGCRMLRGAMPHAMPKRDAELYFGRFPCYVCQPLKVVTAEVK